VKEQKKTDKHPSQAKGGAFCTEGKKRISKCEEEVPEILIFSISPQFPIFNKIFLLTVFPSD
jgi:hypothetical protein